MDRIPKDETREDRIDLEAVVDAYGAEERAMGWYYYLSNRIDYDSEAIPAQCMAERAISPLMVGDEVEILGMAPAEECEHEMFVMIRWGTPGEKQSLGVPLSQLKVTHASEQTREAIEDWRYWVNRGYQF
ncbi:MAG: calcium-binding protein [Chloroflexota bacterium]|nr:calcium-binding protein [Chloroflexota bacterium]